MPNRFITIGQLNIDSDRTTGLREEPSVIQMTAEQRVSSNVVRWYMLACWLLVNKLM